MESPVYLASPCAGLDARKPSNWVRFSRGASSASLVPCPKIFKRNEPYQCVPRMGSWLVPLSMRMFCGRQPCQLADNLPGGRNPRQGPTRRATAGTGFKKGTCRCTQKQLITADRPLEALVTVGPRWCQSRRANTPVEGLPRPNFCDPKVRRRTRRGPWQAGF